MRWLPLWLMPQLALAAGFQVGLVWEFPRAYSPPPAAFLITYSSEAGDSLEQMQTAPSAPGACAVFGASDPDAYCTAWPACPPPGVRTFWVQAVWEGEESAPSPIALCLFTTAQPCVCQDPTQQEEAPAVPPVADLPPETTPAYWSGQTAAVLVQAPAPAA